VTIRTRFQINLRQMSCPRHLLMLSYERIDMRDRDRAALSQPLQGLINRMPKTSKSDTLRVTRVR
jgi:hypothetical protein